MNSKKMSDKSRAIKNLVSMSLMFHNLNKMLERNVGISLVQYHFLNTLRDRPASSPLVLAEAVGMHPSTLTQTMKRLSRKSMLFVGEDPKDSRKKILSLTLEGKLALEVFENKFDNLLQSDKKLSSWVEKSTKDVVASE